MGSHSGWGALPNYRTIYQLKIWPHGYLYLQHLHAQILKSMHFITAKGHFKTLQARKSCLEQGVWTG